MSVKLMGIVWPLDLRVSEKMVLLALADNANDEGYCWPLVSTLVSKCSLSERAIQQALSNLVEAGHVSIHRRAGRSNYYTVHPRSSCTPQDMHPAAAAPTPATGAGTPAARAPTPAAGAPITIIDPSEPSKNHQAQGGARAAPPAAPRRSVGAASAQFEATALQKLSSRREAIGIGNFRDPLQGETSAQYTKAQDAECNRLMIERERRRSQQTVTELMAAKAARQ